ncbi:MAG: hypothetical protein NTY84_05035 [Verrucomicrobia bacterium]|nr:hypothetical protein [Verrucomicrobiota bacterium]
MKRIILLVLTGGVVLLFLKIRQPNSKSYSFSGKLIDSVLTNRLVNIEKVNSNLRSRRIETLGFLVGTGPMLISEEYESGAITNLYQFPSGKLITEVVLPNPKTPLLGSADYEMLAEQDYIKSAAMETNLVEIKEIFEEFSLAKKSQYLYSGIREAYVLMAKLYRLEDSGLLISAEQDIVEKEIWSVSDPVERELKSKEVYNRVHEEALKIWLEKADAPNRFKQRMERLYGEFPKPIFQRLMSLEITTEPKELVNP